MGRRIIGWVAVFLLLAVVAGAQGLGTIVGTVTDATGAVIPDAAVRLRQTDTGIERTAKANAQGYFSLPSLPPSVYEIEVTSAGFEPFRRVGIVLGVDQSVTVNAQLGLAGTVESVTVSAAVAPVNTTTGTLSQVVDGRRIVELPLNGRNAATLTLLVPGAVTTPSNGVDQGFTKTFPAAVTISTNGSRQSQISYNMDGGNNEDEFTNVNQPFPFPDALQEFSVQTSNYSAQHGQNSGGVVNVVTKSGTNQFRGSGFEFLRNSALNAKNYFAAEVDKLKRNQFGATVGGPIARDRTFAFLGYQGTRIQNTSSRSATVPTMANLNGDFSALLNAADPANPQPGKVIKIVDPLSGKPFPGNMIPTTRFDPAALEVARRLPQVDGTGQFRYIQPLQQTYDEFLGRADHSFSNRHKLTVRYFYDRFGQAEQYDPANLLTYSDSAAVVSQNALAHYQYISGSGSILNDMRFTYSSVKADRSTPEAAPTMSSLGVKFYDGGLTSIQNIQVRNFFTIGDDPPAQFDRMSLRWTDDVTWVRGRHTISVGGSAGSSSLDVRNKTNMPGSFTFTADVTKYAPAAFLLGQMNQFVQGSGQFFENRATFVGLYLQDDFHASRRLTLNLGIRYDPVFPWRAQRGRVMMFDPAAYESGVRSQIFANAPPGLLFQGDAGVPKWGYMGDYNNVSPRFGFAWDVRGNGTLSVRGGAGVFYDSRIPGITGQTWGSTTPFSVTLNVTRPAGAFSDPYAGTTNPFPAPSPTPANITFPTPVSAYGFVPNSNYVTPATYNWNVNVEKQAWSGALLRMAYVGTRGRNINEYISLNPALYIPGSALSTDKRRLYQPYGLIGQFVQDVSSSYDALQVSFERRAVRGVTILANYTLARSYDNYPVNQNVVSMNINLPNVSTIPWNMPGRHEMDYGPSLFNRVHRFVTSYVWELPRTTRGGSFVRALGEGWQVSGVLSAQTGVPLTIVAGVDQSQTGLNADRAVQVGTALGGNACGSLAKCVSYLDPTAFQVPAVGTFGTTRKGSVRGPGSFTWDFAVSKNQRLPGNRFRLQFRLEYFNLLNRVNLNDPGVSVSGSSFGQILSAQAPRIGQISAKLLF
jgi:hypothetical protein